MEINLNSIALILSNWKLSLCFQLYIFITNCDMARSKDNSSHY